eukprot:6775724-Prymnesium_polylepis.2
MASTSPECTATTDALRASPRMTPISPNVWPWCRVSMCRVTSRRPSESLRITAQTPRVTRNNSSEAVPCCTMRSPPLNFCAHAYRLDRVTAAMGGGWHVERGDNSGVRVSKDGK